MTVRVVNRFDQMRDGGSVLAVNRVRRPAGINLPQHCGDGLISSSGGTGIEDEH